MSDAYIYDGGRIPFGRHGGALSSIRPDDLLGDIIRTLIQRNAFDLNQYEDVIAGNASGINDGASALIIGSQQAGEKAGIRPRARILAGAIAGVEPRVMGLGPVPASRKALARAGLTMADMDVLEFNEAFATQAL
nr:hypothetical protein [Endozoicomonas acroporae]